MSEFTWEPTENAKADELVQEGARLLKAGDWSNALLAFGEARQIEPGHAGAARGIDLAHDAMDADIDGLGG